MTAKALLRTVRWRWDPTNEPRLPVVRHAWRRVDRWPASCRYEVNVVWGDWSVNAWAPTRTLAVLWGYGRIAAFRLFAWLP